MNGSGAGAARQVPAAGARALAVPAAAVALTLAAFMKVSAGDPLASVGGRQSVYELALLGLSTALLLLGRSFRMPPLSLLFRGPILAVLLYGLLGVASALWSPGPMLSLGKGLELILLTLNAALAAGALHDHGRLVKLPALVAASVLAVVVLFAGVNVAFFGTPLYFSGDEVGRARLQLGHTHPLTVGALAALGFLAGLTARLRPTTKGLLLVVFAVLLLLTKARGSIFATMVATLMVPAARHKLRDLLAVRARSSLLAAGVLAASLLVALSTEAMRRFLYDLSPDVETLNGRLDLWAIALGLAEDHPFLGHGYHASRYVLLDVRDWAGQAHQVPLEIFLNTGAVGLALFAWFAMATVPVAFRNIFLFVAGVYLLPASFVNPVLFQPGVEMYVLTLAVAAVLLEWGARGRRWRRDAWSPPGLPRSRPRDGLPGAGGERHWPRGAPGRLPGDAEESDRADAPAARVGWAAGHEVEPRAVLRIGSAQVEA